MFVTVEQDVHIFVQDVNPGPSSKTVFFVHGWPLNHQMYQYQLNVLPEHGFHDQLIPYKSAELTQKRIKNAQLHALTNSGHGSPIDQADELNAELIKFLNS